MKEAKTDIKIIEEKWFSKDNGNSERRFWLFSVFLFIKVFTFSIGRVPATEPASKDVLSQPTEVQSVQTTQISHFIHLLTNCSVILDLLNPDIFLFIFFSCQNHLITYLFYIFSRKYSAKLKNHKVIMQIKKRKLRGKKQQRLKFQNYTHSEFIISWNRYKKNWEYLQFPSEKQYQWLTWRL